MDKERKNKSELMRFLVDGIESYERIIKKDFWNIEEASCLWFGLTKIEFEKLNKNNDDLLKQIKIRKMIIDLTEECLAHKIPVRHGSTILLNPIHFLKWGLKRLKTDNIYLISKKFLNNLSVMLLDYFFSFDSYEFIINIMNKGTQNYHKVLVVCKTKELLAKGIIKKETTDSVLSAKINHSKHMIKLKSEINRECKNKKIFKEIDTYSSCSNKDLLNKIKLNQKGYSDSTFYNWISIAITDYFSKKRGRPKKNL